MLNCKHNQEIRKTRLGVDSNTAELFRHVCIFMGDLHLVPSALNHGCWHFDNRTSSKIDEVITEHGELLHVLSLAVHLRCVASMILVSALVPLKLIGSLNRVGAGPRGLGTKGLGLVKRIKIQELCSFSTKSKGKHEDI